MIGIIRSGATVTALLLSGNKTEVTRKVIVKKPVISVNPDKGSRVGYSTYNATLSGGFLRNILFGLDMPLKKAG